MCHCCHLECLRDRRILAEKHVATWSIDLKDQCLRTFSRRLQSCQWEWWHRTGQLRHSRPLLSYDEWSHLWNDQRGCLQLHQRKVPGVKGAWQRRFGGGRRHKFRTCRTSWQTGRCFGRGLVWVRRRHLNFCRKTRSGRFGIVQLLTLSDSIPW